MVYQTAPDPTAAPIPWDALATPLSAADDALARFDERLRTSPIRDGVIARLDFADACACLWVAGEFVTPEDLVLHDAERDLRMPSHALTQAHTVLRTRRRIARQSPDWALRSPGLANLRGSAERGGEAVTLTTASSPPAARDPLVFDPDWDEDTRLTDWQQTLAAHQNLPPVLAAALAWDAWESNRPAATPALARPLAGRIDAAGPRQSPFAVPASRSAPPRAHPAPDPRSHRPVARIRARLHRRRNRRF